MTVYLWTMVVLHALGVLFSLGHLGSSKPWPRERKVSPASVVIGLLMNVVLAVWSAWYLYQMRGMEVQSQ